MNRSNPPVEYDVFPLMASTEEEIDETRYHILKFHSAKKIDPLVDFEPPTRLHRKDPKNLQFQMSLKELDEKRKVDQQKAQEQVKKREEFVQRTGKHNLTNEEIDEELEIEGLNEEDRIAYEEDKRKMKQLKEKELEKEKKLQAIAPDGGARKKKRQPFQKRTKQVKVYNEAKRKLRYEEFYPWILEDYDASQAWVGNFEAGLSDNYCMLVLDKENKCFKLAPIEKFYKFTSRNKYATLTLEEAEAKMKQGSSGQRWLMRKMLDEATTGKRVDLRYRKVPKIKGENDLTIEDDEDDINGIKKSDEDEDLDFDDEFQDDEEAPIMEGPDEEKKIIESKMKKEMLSANNLIEKIPIEEDDDEDMDDLFDVKPEDKESKRLRMALSKNAMNEVYASDDDENPYLSDSDIENKSDEDEVKVKTEPTEGEIKVKSEPTDDFNDDNNTNNTTESPRKKRKKNDKKIYVDNYRSGFITIKAVKSILSKFPIGEWNPRTAIHRDITDEDVKDPIIKDENNGNNGINPDKLTKADIDELLVNGPIDLSALVKALRPKMQRDPESKHTLKKILKDNFTLQNKQVHRKE
ncbi:transcription factor IIF subunit [Pichia kluyveri]|uniref:Transcription initiation factor IIF subunit alpha n=1 Tax=Pichia kluyveri TaxID=36015 RepID=A0AAV5RAC3_PICKL|nr:transcription factor IIF subunit [Pichia kluyveri]